MPQKEEYHYEIQLHRNLTESLGGGAGGYFVLLLGLQDGGALWQLCFRLWAETDAALFGGGDAFGLALADELMLGLHHIGKRL